MSSSRLRFFGLGVELRSESLESLRVMDRVVIEPVLPVLVFGLGRKTALAFRRCLTAGEGLLL